MGVRSALSPSGASTVLELSLETSGEAAAAEVRTWLSEALEGLRGGYWRVMEVDAGGGMEIFALSTLELVVPGSAERPLRLDSEEADEREWVVGRDWLLFPLSLLSVRCRVSMGQWEEVVSRRVKDMAVSKWVFHSKRRPR